MIFESKIEILFKRLKLEDKIYGIYEGGVSVIDPSLPLPIFKIVLTENSLPHQYTPKLIKKKTPTI